MLRNIQVELFNAELINLSFYRPYIYIYSGNMTVIILIISIIFNDMSVILLFYNYLTILEIKWKQSRFGLIAVVGLMLRNIIIYWELRTKIV